MVEITFIKTHSALRCNLLHRSNLFIECQYYQGLRLHRSRLYISLIKEIKKIAFFIRYFILVQQFMILLKFPRLMNSLPS
jgi:hypothetical protein